MTLSPPEGYSSWLEYAITSMETRDLYLQSCDESPWGRIVDREEFRAAAEDERQKLIDALADMVSQHCTIEDGEINSGAISANADAMRALAGLGVIQLTMDSGRLVKGKWVKEA